MRNMKKTMTAKTRAWRAKSLVSTLDPLLGKNDPTDLKVLGCARKKNKIARMSEINNIFCGVRTHCLVESVDSTRAESFITVGIGYLDAIIFWRSFDIIDPLLLYTFFKK